MATTIDPDTCVFTFGSNRRGIHGAGAARYAAQHKGARGGVGEGYFDGPRGGCYALPTKDSPSSPSAWADIENAATRFLSFTESRPDLTFIVTRLGCGLAGYSDADMAPLFQGAPSNCLLPGRWNHVLNPGLASVVVVSTHEPAERGFVAGKLDKIQRKFIERGTSALHLVLVEDGPVDADAAAWVEDRGCVLSYLAPGVLPQWAAWAGSHAVLFRAKGAAPRNRYLRTFELESLPYATLNYERAAPVSRLRREPGN